MRDTIGPAGRLCSGVLLAIALSVCPAVGVTKPAGKLKLPTPTEEPEAIHPVQLEAHKRAKKYEIAVRFDRALMGPSCDAHCPSALLYVDTDNQRATGLQLGKDAAETGADLAVNLEVQEESAPVPMPDGGVLRKPPKQSLKVRVRMFSNTTGPEGEMVTELDSRKDAAFVHVSRNTARLTLDPGLWRVPRGTKSRLIFHPPEKKALTAIADPLPPAVKVSEPAAPAPLKKAPKHRSARTHAGGGGD